MTGQEEPKVRIVVNSNSNMSRGKYAAAAVHAALTAAGVHPGLPVIVLGGQRDDVVRMRTVIRDAGRTEVEPGTPTAGTDWAPARVDVLDVELLRQERDSARAERAKAWDEARAAMEAYEMGDADWPLNPYRTEGEDR